MGSENINWNLCCLCQNYLGTNGLRSTKADEEAPGKQQIRD